MLPLATNVSSAYRHYVEHPRECKKCGYNWRARRVSKPKKISSTSAYFNAVGGTPNKDSPGRPQLVHQSSRVPPLVGLPRMWFQQDQVAVLCRFKTTVENRAGNASKEAAATKADEAAWRRQQTAAARAAQAALDGTAQSAAALANQNNVNTGQAKLSKGDRVVSRALGSRDKRGVIEKKSIGGWWVQFDDGKRSQVNGDKLNKI